MEKSPLMSYCLPLENKAVIFTYFLMYNHAKLNYLFWPISASTFEE